MLVSTWFPWCTAPAKIFEVLGDLVPSLAAQLEPDRPCIRESNHSGPRCIELRHFGSVRLRTLQEDTDRAIFLRES
jgi:hypothetical protein